ncbi:hypothetical protein B0I37DRAFT_99490 [Chaetomium sp. MPI-CAGE-AT-0009]|nr:hypothetical protein B0I37DRAFT_99490 [Chaetomium sp. MPI-CAGE-AT-0009]
MCGATGMGVNWVGIRRRVQGLPSQRQLGTCLAREQAPRVEATGDAKGQRHMRPSLGAKGLQEQNRLSRVLPLGLEALGRVGVINSSMRFQQGDGKVGKADTYLTGEGEDSRSRRLSVLRGWPWGSDGFRGGWNVTDVVEDVLCPTDGRLLSSEDCRELSRWHSSEMDARVAVLASVDTDTNGRDNPLRLGSPLARDSSEKYSAGFDGAFVPGDTSESGLLAAGEDEVNRTTLSKTLAIV